MEETKNIETTDTEVSGTEQNGKFYTEDEINMLIQKAGDKRISQYQKTMEKKQRESEKLRNMNETDQREYLLDQREQAISAKEMELQMLENKAEGLSILADKGLDSKLIDLVIHEDADIMYDRIKALDKAFKASVKAEVEKRIGSTVPKQSVIDTDVLTKEQFNKLSLMEQNRIFRDNPELYRQMTK